MLVTADEEMMSLRLLFDFSFLRFFRPGSEKVVRVEKKKV